MNTIQLAAIREALRKAFTQKHFSLSGVQQAHAVLYPNEHFYVQETPQGKADLAVMQALHCVDWENLTMPERRELYETCCRVLRIEPNVIGDFDQIASVRVSSNLLPPITNA